MCPSKRILENIHSEGSTPSWLRPARRVSRAIGSRKQFVADRDLVVKAG